MAELKNQVILVVDDNRISSRVTSAFLSSLGASVETAFDENELLRKLNDNITAIFLNLVMPRISGYQIASEVRLINKNIPMYAITTDDYDKMTKEMIQAGFTEVIKKPFTKENIIELFSSLESDLPVFDQSSYIKTFKDPELQQDIIDTFLNEEEADTKRLLESFETKDKDKIYSAIHYMKGSFTYLKASKILVLTQEMLDRLKVDDVEYALANKEKFMKQYFELLNVLRKV